MIAPGTAGRGAARHIASAIGVSLLFAVAATTSDAQVRSYHGRVGHDGCRPVAQRDRELGCWIHADVRLGTLPPSPVFWYLDTYASRAQAEAASDGKGVVVESFGRIWLFTIARAQPSSSGGTHVATIGPLPTAPSTLYTAKYMEAVFTPGMTSSMHRHSGPEIWYTLAGETCLETSEGVSFGRAGGEPVIVPGGVPMHLTATGTEIRRAIVLILHDSTQPSASPANDWTPKGLCRQH